LLRSLFDRRSAVAGDNRIKVEGDVHDSWIVTGSYNLLVQFGLTPTPPTYRGLIRRFLQAYLGSPQAPVPFGGRDAQIVQLNQWLAEPDATSNLLVTAPAGRGKTSLLVHWLSEVDRESWPVAFVPISIRYGTNRAAAFYQALAAHLAETLGKKLLSAPADPASFYRDKVIEYLDLFSDVDRRCLVVIDGLDEAAGWQVDTSVFPLNPAPGLRIVASARLLAGDEGSADWLRRIGWKSSNSCTVDVPPLDRDGIADVLRNMGVPLADLSGHVDILSELLRLTTGDPLLVSLYVEELWENRHSTHGLRPEDLSSMEPGFAAFFKRWWEEQRRAWWDAGAAIDEDLTQAILAVLACALGPIRFVELERLVREVHAVRTVFSVDSLRPIERLVIGDGRVVGYSLSHPKLAEYFRNEHFRGGEVIQRTQTAFIEWGRSTVRALNSGALSPSSDPDYAYLLNHYSQHWLASAETKSHPSERVEALLELVSDGWRQAWEAYEGGFQGFAGDVRTAWDAVRQVRRLNDRQSGTTHLGVEIRCALCLSSICSMGSNIPANLLALAVACDAMSIQQARHIAELKGGEPENRVQALMALAPNLPEQEKLSLLEDIRALPDEANRSQALIQMAGCLPAGEQRRSVLAEARSAALQAQRPDTAASILSLLLPLLSDDQDRIALASKAMEAAEQVNDGLTRALLLADIAYYLLPDQASAARAKAINTARSTTGPARCATALVDLALRLPEQDPYTAKLCREAIDVADRVLSEPSAGDAYRDFHIGLAVNARARALALLASTEPDSQRRLELLDLSQAIVRSLPSDYFRVDALTSLIPHLPVTRRAAMLEEALQLARTLPTGNNRTHALGALAALLSPNQQREVVLEALNAARLIEDEYGRFLTFIRIAKQSESRVSSAAISRATALIRSGIGYVIHRAEALGALAPFLATSEQRQALTEALQLAARSPNPQFRISAIINLIPQLPQDLQQVAVRHVLDAHLEDPFRALHLVAFEGGT
jgi:hypothetical protein